MARVWQDETTQTQYHDAECYKGSSVFSNQYSGSAESGILSFCHSTVDANGVTLPLLDVESDPHQVAAEDR
ncbi:MAG: hypothetical protein BroJett011_14080 [Chloroflexota bacterium]|nr:MAG: hypothetical protein BroJett011_14080 [Chloroflexota bacterium]